MNKVYFHSSEKMLELNDKSIDLVVTHPPYQDTHYETLLKNVFGEVYRVLKNNKVVVTVNTDVKRNDFFPKHILIHDVLTKLGFVLRDIKIWVRTDFNRFDRLGYSFIQIFSKGDYKKNVYRDFEAGIWRLPYSMNTENFRDAYHPEIVHRCLEAFTQEKDIILDPFLGSGTTLKTAKDYNRQVVGYEIDESLKDLIYRAHQPAL